MLAHIWATFAAARSVAYAIYGRRGCLVAGIVLSAVSVGMSGCAIPLSLGRDDPADPAASVAKIEHRSSVGPYTSPRPVAPAPWRQKNENVTPPPKSGD